MDAAAQHTHWNALRFRTVTVTYVCVTNVDFTNQLANEVVHIVAVGAIGQQFSVFLLHSEPIHAVHVGRIEEVAHLAPGLVVNLCPLGAQLDPFLHIAKVDFTIATTFARFAGLHATRTTTARHWAFRCVDHFITTPFAHKHLGAIGGEFVTHATANVCDFLRLGIEEVQSAAVATDSHKIQAILDTRQIPVASRIDGQHHHSIADALEVDFHFLGFLFTFGFTIRFATFRAGAIGFATLRTIWLAFELILGSFFVAFSFHFVVLSEERRWCIFLQGKQIDL